MQILSLMLLAIIAVQSETIFDFNQKSDLTGWTIVDDVVMGGRSAGSFYIDDDGHGVFSGSVSLENNGGFSSLRYRFNRINTRSYTKVVLRLKGDGKSYQFRVKSKVSDYYSYTSQFQTTDDWVTIEISLADMAPEFRGRRLSIPNYSSDGIEEIAFLIGNKKAEDFSLRIDNISLK